MSKLLKLVTLTLFVNSNFSWTKKDWSPRNQTMIKLLKCHIRTTSNHSLLSASKKSEKKSCAEDSRMKSTTKRNSNKLIETRRRRKNLSKVFWNWRHLRKIELSWVILQEEIKVIYLIFLLTTRRRSWRFMRYCFHIELTKTAILEVEAWVHIFQTLDPMFMVIMQSKQWMGVLIQVLSPSKTSRSLTK